LDILLSSWRDWGLLNQTLPLINPTAYLTGENALPGIPELGYGSLTEMMDFGGVVRTHLTDPLSAFLRANPAASLAQIEAEIRNLGAQLPDLDFQIDLAGVLAERLQNVVDNLKGASTWRPRDVFNFANMLWNMPRPAKRQPSSLNPAQVALTLFTRMSLSYEPQARPGQTATPSIDELALGLTHEPTVALFVDAPAHLSGVSLTLQSWAEQARRLGMPFFQHMAGSDDRNAIGKCFPNVGTLRLSSYPGLDLPIPDAKAVTDYMRGHPFDVAHLSTPGPMGLLGMRIAQSRGAPICGTYHTDFPRYVRDLTGSEELADFTWQFMIGFYGQMDHVAAPSRSTRDDLIAHGLRPERVHVVGRGVELDTFSPNHRSDDLRRAWGVENKTVLLYVGRLSREKNLPLLAEAYKRLLASGSDAVLVLVGDGPARRRPGATGARENDS
jgi:hypothetical protein